MSTGCVSVHLISLSFLCESWWAESVSAHLQAVAICWLLYALLSWSKNGVVRLLLLFAHGHLGLSLWNIFKIHYSLDYSIN